MQVSMVHLSGSVGLVLVKQKACGLLAKAQATAPVDVRTAHENSLPFVILKSFMSALPIHETKKAQRAMEDRRETDWFSREKAPLFGIKPGPPH